VALAALLFRFHLEQRAQEGGLLAAVGVSPARVLRWRLAEGLVLTLLGGAAGCLLALLYTRLLLRSLASVWDRQAAGSGLALAVNPATLATGLAVFTGLMMLAIWLVTRRQARQAVSIRLSAGTEERPPAAAERRPWWALAWALVAILALTGSRWLGTQGAFFLAGFALLAAGLAAYRWLLRRRWSKGGSSGGELTVARLARLNCARRPTRSAVVAGTLAAGVFMVVSVAAFRKHGGDDLRQRHSGTGGFALWVETNRPVHRASGITPEDPLGLGDARPQFGEILPLRVGPGDDASCLNLNQVLRPRLLAVDSAALDRRGAFAIKRTLAGCAPRWETLREGAVMRAFVDESTLLWVLKRKLGEHVIYQDDWGRDYPVEIAGTLDDSLFQGSFLVDDARLLQPEGPRVFLLDTGLPPAEARSVLAQALADCGPQIETTAERMAAFHGVENTYIRIFQVLGGLGVILGSAGIALLTVRSMIERRGEFAILHTLGIPPAKVRRLALAEAIQLVGWGLGIGLGAALLAILPGLGAAGIAASLAWLALLAALIAAIAWLGSALACRRYFKASFTVAGEEG
jgi:predicted lysophospholipase L1 biosynthesis ABC-type transport system permease subunit